MTHLIKDPPNQLNLLEKKQLALSLALRHFLYESIATFNLPPSFQKLISCLHLRNAEKLFELETPHITDACTVKVYSKRLSFLYHLWQTELCDCDTSEHVVIPNGKQFEQWTKDGGCSRRYNAVRSLRRVINKRHQRHFVRAIVHGSVGTLDDEVGFSDLDTAFIIRAKSLVDHQELLNLRKAASAILASTYQFDPYMHHGPFWISEIDLKWYPESFLPLEVFRHGVELLSIEAETMVSRRKSDHLTGRILESNLESLRVVTTKEFELTTPYEVELHLGSAMILPTLFLHHRFGKTVYKKHSFEEARPFFTKDEWLPIKNASLARKALPKRHEPKPLEKIVSQAFNWPHILKRSGWINADGSHQPALAMEIVGKDFLQQVLRLNNKMLTTDVN